LLKAPPGQVRIRSTSPHQLLLPPSQVSAESAEINIENQNQNKTKFYT